MADPAPYLLSRAAQREKFGQRRIQGDTSRGYNAAEKYKEQGTSAARVGSQGFGTTPESDWNEFFHQNMQVQQGAAAGTGGVESIPLTRFGRGVQAFNSTGAPMSPTATYQPSISGDNLVTPYGTAGVRTQTGAGIFESDALGKSAVDDSEFAKFLGASRRSAPEYMDAAVQASQSFLGSRGPQPYRPRTFGSRY